MNGISFGSETQTSQITRYEYDENGDVVEVTEEISLIILTVVTDSMSVDEISDAYAFSTKQDEMLDELLSEDNADLWAGIR